jgi:hypothetical protein
VTAAPRRGRARLVGRIGGKGGEWRHAVPDGLSPAERRQHIAHEACAQRVALDVAAHREPMNVGRDQKA